MQINIDTPIKRIDKDEIIQSGSECPMCKNVVEGEDLTFRKAAIRALLNSSVTKPEEKMQRFTLAQMLQAGPPTLELDNDQISWIQADVAAAYGILVLGRIYEVLDPTKMDKLLEAAKPVDKKKAD